MIDKLADKLVRYSLAKGYQIDRTPGAVNIIYLEGANADGTANADHIDGWNDRRLIVMFDLLTGLPFVALNATATTEPGLSATNNKEADKLGGVARIQFGQFRVWEMGYHKSDKRHPALVQRAPLFVFRDRNKDGKRTGDLISSVTGLNQHSVLPASNGKAPDNVGNHSAGCLVGLFWSLHLTFIDLCQNHPEYVEAKKAADRAGKRCSHKFYTTIINGDEFAKFL